MSRTILVTGAGSGIGQVVAARLLARGDSVIASARSLDQLSGCAEAGARIIAMDVGDDASVALGFSAVSTLDAVVHCAAVAPLGTVEFTPCAKVAEIHNINTLGALRVLQRSLPLLRASPSGRLLLLSSLWGQVSGPFVSAYAASKHAIEALADAARREMRGRGVHISVIEPGVVKTPMYFKQLDQLDQAIAAIGPAEQSLYASLYADHRKLVARAEKTAITAEQCAAVIEGCLDARRPLPRYRAGADAKLMVALGRTLTDRGLDRLFGLMYRG